MIFIPCDTQKKGVLLKFKTSDRPEKLKAKAEEALGQIKEKQYVEAFKQHQINNVL